MDDFSDRHGLTHRVLGGRKGGQPLDIVSCAQQCLEKGFGHCVFDTLRTQHLLFLHHNPMNIINVYKLSRC